MSKEKTKQKRKRIAGPIDLDTKSFTSEVKPFARSGAYIPAHELFIGRKVKVTVIESETTAKELKT